MMITQKLADAIIAGNEETLDIYSLTVRGIITECKEEFANSLIKTLYPCVYKGIEAGSAPVKEECLEICTELFKQFGLIILRQQDLINREQLMKAINNQLASGSTASLKKRASQAMGAFAIILNQASLNQLCTLLLTKIKSGTNKADKVT